LIFCSISICIFHYLFIWISSHRIRYDVTHLNFKHYRYPTCGKILETLLESLALFLRFSKCTAYRLLGSEALLANDELGDEAHQDGGNHSANGAGARHFRLRHGSISGPLRHFRCDRLVVGLMIAHG